MAQVRDLSGNGVVPDVGTLHYMTRDRAPIRFKDITASTTGDLPDGICLGILCLTAGTVTVVGADDATANTTAIPMTAGGYVEGRFRRVTSVGSGTFKAAY